MTPGGKGTRSGKHWERVIGPVLEIHYSGRYETQVPVGRQLYGGDYVADFVIRDSRQGDVVVSAKWQEVPGTAEQKILYDIASLLRIVRDSEGRFRKGYVVLGGPGFSSNARQFLLGQGHREVLADGDTVEVVSLEEFLARANRGAL